MLSYQHAYHAGNFADVHKHLCLRLLFEALLKKDKAFCYVDCHAGAGSYDLGAPEALRTGEAEAGIGRLWVQRSTLSHPAVAAYLDAVAAANGGAAPGRYPGSPALALRWLREQDRAILFELHPQSVALLRAGCAGEGRVSIHARDCYEGLPALVPPVIRRGLVLLDPSYELKEEYRSVVTLVAAARRRWSTAIYAIWYPLLRAARHRELLAALAALDLPATLVSELTVGSADDANGLYGSGLAMINAPWQLDRQLGALLPAVATALAGDRGRVDLRWLHLQEEPDRA